MNPEIQDKKLYIETYGCQMNVADTEVVASIMEMDGYSLTENDSEADAIFVNTCSIRENAEQKVIQRLEYFNSLRRKRKDSLIIGVLGCMAERAKSDLIDNHNVDVVVGPDAYLDLPNLVGAAEQGEKAMNVELSKTETYKDVMPLKLNGSNISGYISIMRGCDKFCTYCIVPFTRGRERSREPESILNELKNMQMKGFREVILLGQNVNSYRYKDGDTKVDFHDLLAMVAEAAPEMRIRFTTSHPWDMNDETLETIAKYKNLANYIHLPVQSGSSRMMKLMNRRYNREWYMKRIAAIKRIIPDCGISTDIMCGFHSETEEDHQETLSLMKEVGFDSAFMFKYSQRPGTYAAKKLEDNVPEDVKTRRLQEIIDLQLELSRASNERDMNKEFEVLIEGFSKRSREQLFGRNEQNKVVIFDKKNHRIGQFVKVKITGFTSATLFGETVDSI
ncbi:MAG TPA: tRNA (N6-isopentenyl adenosine(37)-C2)-methylthiotransferase MiaB [Fermentimonas caenicola]|jgi:tRNA-2-methylthio-N6-dimethylallyladenosine synthase|uniref:tRNA (N6-isopentenyl adenosine(37)-C2)-methylthiotransferase MiaB n=1 Tax=Lascolabacillus TaxID=1924067 RepID=UPI0006B2F98E|nr:MULTISPECIES: tRNA (N6-isopentenyl adenosine(37)-C2)-methylthiotransferase MiaB [Lascolabacillus]MBP6176645.1 tRNA (N6-isopentenyl adenosine(37)-C2)-methylthiotransferase MiaB [Fermentimonas sp.]MBP6197177.1 tRNA (N6-isopentenyl adenosine(37)-C2)-methylthiotransferase MiaB [Fermentimonas sp.]MDD3658368.1 tRNA (N6-isopentenyl adenosine(37)-C2)-methylthiotransferase MiaB [Lascolabacillus sp.]HHU42586.1 tRNA (N6-isopentenyl adenosine(37)-C2)-methylthiotransferase MiaB [Fermentimonas caenicola]